MAMTEKYLFQLKMMIQDDITVIREAGVSTDPLGTLLFWANHGKIFLVIAAGEEMYEKFHGISTKGRAFIASLRRFVMAACNAIYYRKTRDCGFSSNGIRYSDRKEMIVSWEELCAEFHWGKNPEFVFRIERIHKL